MTNVTRSLRKLKRQILTKRRTRRRFVVGSVALLLVLVVAAVWIGTRDNDDVTVSKNPVVQEYQQQLPTLKKKAKDNSKNPSAHIDYAVALYATGNIKQAKQEYEAAAKLDNKNATVHNNLGNAYRDLGDIDKAIEAYQQAITLNPKLINPYFNLANIQLYSQKDADAAIKTYQKALTSLPDNEQVLLSLGIAYEQKNDKTKAKQVYQSILAKDAGNAAAKANLDRLNK